MEFIVFVHKCQIKVAHVSCHSLEPSNLNVVNAEYEEMRLCDIDKAGFSWL